MIDQRIERLLKNQETILNPSSMDSEVDSEIATEMLMARANTTSMMSLVDQVRDTRAARRRVFFHVGGIIALMSLSLFMVVRPELATRVALIGACITALVRGLAWLATRRIQKSKFIKFRVLSEYLKSFAFFARTGSKNVAVLVDRGLEIFRKEFQVRDILPPSAKELMEEYRLRMDPYLLVKGDDGRRTLDLTGYVKTRVLDQRGYFGNRIRKELAPTASRQNRLMQFLDWASTLAVAFSSFGPSLSMGLTLIHRAIAEDPGLQAAKSRLQSYNKTMSRIDTEVLKPLYVHRRQQLFKAVEHQGLSVIQAALFFDALRDRVEEIFTRYGSIEPYFPGGDAISDWIVSQGGQALVLSEIEREDAILLPTIVEEMEKILLEQVGEFDTIMTGAAAKALEKLEVKDK